MKIVVLSGYTKSLVNFRGDLIKDMAACGCEVVAAGPETGYENELAVLGARFVRMPVKRTGINPIKDIYTLVKIVKLLKKEKPDVVFSYSIKPVVYGSIAARLAGVKKIYSMVTGLGYVFSDKGLKARLLKLISIILYFLAFASCTKVIFQNKDDMKELIDLGLLKAGKCVTVNGSGVNLSKYVPVPLPQKINFLMICRVLKDKGVMEYLKAARTVKKKHPSAGFRLLGPFDSNPNSLKYEHIKPYIDDGSIEYVREKKDVRPLIAGCSVYVLPSYREGTPRTVLEAMAMGRPVITTDAPGCRDTVTDGVNGFRVGVGDPESLASKIRWFLEHPEKIAGMGAESLRICREKYDVEVVNSVMLEIMGIK